MPGEGAYAQCGVCCLRESRAAKKAAEPVGFDGE